MLAMCRLPPTRDKRQPFLRLMIAISRRPRAACTSWARLYFYAFGGGRAARCSATKLLFDMQTGDSSGEVSMRVGQRRLPRAAARPAGCGNAARSLMAECDTIAYPR